MYFSEDAKACVRLILYNLSYLRFVCAEIVIQKVPLHRIIGKGGNIMLLSGYTFYPLRRIFPVKDTATRFIRFKSVTVGLLSYNKSLR